MPLRYHYASYAILINRLTIALSLAENATEIDTRNPGTSLIVIINILFVSYGVCARKGSKQYRITHIQSFVQLGHQVKNETKYLQPLSR